MKIKAINRSESECTRERGQDIQKVHKNLDPALHPFEKAVEYTRALNAAKLDRSEIEPAVYYSGIAQKTQTISGKVLWSASQSRQQDADMCLFGSLPGSLQSHS